MTGIDWAILLIYFVFVLGIGVVLKSAYSTSTDFFLPDELFPRGSAVSHLFPQILARKK